MIFTFILVYSFSTACNCTVNCSNYRQAFNIAQDLVAGGADVTIGIEYNSIVYACSDCANPALLISKLATANIPPSIALESIRQIACNMVITENGEIA